MAGHSKWNNIKRKKEKTDAEKAKVFTKIGREMSVAIKEGGADPAVNFRLASLIAKAKANNVPNDNIERAIKKAASADTASFESITYEGYGPCGVAMLVECLTDNRNRTAADMRHYFDKFGGNLGQPGCVSFMFERKGILLIANVGQNEEQVMEDALEAGALDFEAAADGFEIQTDPDDFRAVLAGLSAKGYVFETAEIAYIPDTYTALTDPEAQVKMQKLLDHLEDNDDVQDVWHNLEESVE